MRLLGNNMEGTTFVGISMEQYTLKTTGQGTVCKLWRRFNVLTRFNCGLESRFDLSRPAMRCKRLNSTKSTAQACNTSDAVGEMLNRYSVVRLSLDVLFDILVLGHLALLGACSRLLGSGLLTLLGSLWSVLGVPGSADGLGRHGDLVLGWETRVALGPGILSVTC